MRGLRGAVQRATRHPGWRVGLTCLAATFLSACGFWVGECDDTGGGASSCAPEIVPCESWETFVHPPGNSRTQGEVQIVPDRSVTPPRADLAVGSRFHARLGVRFEVPEHCRMGALGDGIRWRVTDGAVLQVESVDSDQYGAMLIALGPGTARVVAENLALPGRGVGHAELTVCREPGASVLFCSLVPLDIHVTP